MKKTLWILATFAAILVAAFLVLGSWSRKFWERTLDGPFTGLAYSGSITTAPVSVLTVPSRGQLEVHELPSYTNPVILLRSPAGDIRWARLFLPEKQRQDGSANHSALHELRLRTWEQRRTGPVVFVVCNWDWGGREGGLIELDADFGFRSFSLSW